MHSHPGKFGQCLPGDRVSGKASGSQFRKDRLRSPDIGVTLTLAGTAVPG